MHDSPLSDSPLPVSPLSDAPLPGSPLPVALLPRSSVLVITGGIGAGHDKAAREIGRRLVGAGHDVRTVDVLDFMPLHLGHVIRWLYFLQLGIAPRSWGTLLAALTPGRPGERLSRRLVGWLGRGLLRATDGCDLVVATHPFAGLALGDLRRHGELRIPAVTYLTDASVHPLWVHPSVDLHLTWNADAAACVGRLGGVARLIRPLLPQPCEAAYATHCGQRIALVTGGSQGVGELARTAADIRDTGLAHPVVMCGHNERLRRHLATIPGITALGWRDDAAQLIAGADVVVQNAGGFTSLDALASGTPVITYRAIPGHGRANSAALAAAGLVPWAHDATELPGVLWAALSRRWVAEVELAGVPALLDVLQPELVAA